MQSNINEEARKTELCVNLENRRRKEMMINIINLHNFFTEKVRSNLKLKDDEMVDFVWTEGQLNKKFNRYYLVETTNHNEEEFTVKVEVRYDLRSQEKRSFGDKHKAFYDGYLSTISFSYSDIYDPTNIKNEISKSFPDKNSDVSVS